MLLSWSLHTSKCCWWSPYIEVLPGPETQLQAMTVQISLYVLTLFPNKECKFKALYVLPTRSLWTPH